MILLFPLCYQGAGIRDQYDCSVPAFYPDSTAASSPDEVCPLKVGQQVPGVTVTDTSGKPVNLLSATQKPTVLVFYRGSWCLYCNRQLSALQEIHDSLQKMGFQLLGISPDKTEKIEEAIRETSYSYTLLSDSKMTAAKAFGIAFRVSDVKVQIHKMKGTSLEKSSGEDHRLLPVPSVFIIRKGEIKFSYVNPNYKVRLDPGLLIAAARATLKD